jgi:hypothetical protein
MDYDLEKGMIKIDNNSIKKMTKRYDGATNQPMKSSNFKGGPTVHDIIITSFHHRIFF